MFQAIIARAKDAVGDVVAHAAVRALLAVPFVIAGGFGIAGLYLRLTREYGAESASLLMAFLFLVIGSVALAILSLRKHYDAPEAAEESAAESESGASTAEASSFVPSFTPAEKDLLLAGLTTAAPIAFPQLVRILLRNLPLLAVIAAAVFVLTRSSTGAQSQGVEPMPAPAE